MGKTVSLKRSSDAKELIVGNVILTRQGMFIRALPVIFGALVRLIRRYTGMEDYLSSSR